MMSRVRGVMAASMRSNGKASVASDWMRRTPPGAIISIETSYMKKPGVQISASSPSSRNATQTR